MNKICEYLLDENQMKIVLDNSKYLLVNAGAGSGKTLTILGKINYLVNFRNIKVSEILCISFTNKSSNSLKEKIKNNLGLDADVFTFHSFSMKVLKDNNLSFEICDSELLDNIVHEFLYVDILKSVYHMKLVLGYYEIYVINVINSYKEFINDKRLKLLEKYIISFIKLYKCNNYSLGDFKIFLKKIRFTFSYKKNKNLLIIILNILLRYNKYLNDNNEIDFDDMIIKTTYVINNDGILDNYKYIIIDEYQDTSYIRFLLICSVINRNNSNLLVVGDDYQSIYKFSGCDLSLFLNFNKYFKDSKILQISNTYRNSSELVSVASKFIMQNKKQLKKDLVSNKHLKNPIKIVYYDNIKYSICKLIERIYYENNGSIMILGRNNKDINLIVSKLLVINNDKLMYIKNKDINIYFMSVHKSKGLEEDNVIIINLIDDYLGFPNKIKNSKLLKLVSKSEDYPYAEERRLFYVALTRTKNKVYLMSPKNNKSIFVKEIEKMSL